MFYRQINHLISNSRRNNVLKLLVRRYRKYPQTGTTPRLLPFFFTYHLSVDKQTGGHTTYQKWANKPTEVLETCIFMFRKVIVMVLDARSCYL